MSNGVTQSQVKAAGSQKSNYVCRAPAPAQKEKPQKLGSCPENEVQPGPRPGILNPKTQIIKPNPKPPKKHATGLFPI